MTCKFKLDECAGSRRDFVVACPNARAASTSCRVADRWFLPHFSVLEVSCPVTTQPNWPGCWVDTRDRSAYSSPVVVRAPTFAILEPKTINPAEGMWC